MTKNIRLLGKNYNTMNKKKIFSLLGMLMMATTAMAQEGSTPTSNQIVKQKVVDNGGSGMFKAVAVKEKGPDDVAYQNAQTDYGRIQHVPVALANHPASGHGGTYHETYGGDYGRLVVDWLDWQLKGKKANADIFLKGDLRNYDGWEEIGRAHV